MKSGVIIMIVELIIIIVLSIFLVRANIKIAQYEEAMPNVEETQKNQESQIQEDKQSSQKDEQNQETIKSLPGTDSKSGLNIQNVEIQTKSKISKLKAEVINNLGEEIGEVSFNICLIDENNNIIDKYPQKVNVKAGEIKKIEVTVNNIEKVQGYYIE